jgi:NAD(P)-dependent dehydrogenase (short-subunit alcohol dehydrogenase family)
MNAANKVALVTGASGGIGRAVATRLSPSKISPTIA